MRQVFYLSEAPSPPMTSYSPPPLLHNVHVYTSILIHTVKAAGGGGGRELTREKVRGEIVHKAGREYQHDWLYLQTVNSIKRQ